MLIENWSWVGLIPLFPLLLSIFYGFTRGLLRWELSNKWVSASLILAVLASFLFSFLSLLDLVADPDGTALVDQVANWIGVGVGSAALVGGLDLRFDPLSAVFCLLVSGVGFLIVLYSVVHMGTSDQEEKGFARFFGLFIFNFFSMLTFVLADNLLILLFGFAALVMSTQLLMGFLYADESLSRSATVAGTVGLVGFGGLFFSVVMAFRGLSEMGRPGLALSKLEESLPALAVATVDLPSWLGGPGIPLPEVLAMGVGVAACALASLWPVLCWLPPRLPRPRADIYPHPDRDDLGGGRLSLGALFALAGPGSDYLWNLGLARCHRCFCVRGDCLQPLRDYGCHGLVFGEPIRLGSSGSGSGGLHGGCFSCDRPILSPRVFC